MPFQAAPMLNFDTNLNNILPSKLKNNYFCIGKNGEGDLICINISNGTIVIVSHENSNDIYIMNSTLVTLQNSIVSYYIFIKEVKKKYGVLGFNKKLYTVNDVEKLYSDLKHIEPDFEKDRSFWSVEINNLRYAIGGY